MKIGHLELFVRDPLKSLTFYRDILDFEMVAVQAENFVWLKLGEQELLLRPKRPFSTTPPCHNSCLAIILYTNNLLDMVTTLRQRGLAIACMPNEANCYTFTDPDGHWFQLVDPTMH